MISDEAKVEESELESEEQDPVVQQLGEALPRQAREYASGSARVSAAAAALAASLNQARQDALSLSRAVQDQQARGEWVWDTLVALADRDPILPSCYAAVWSREGSGQELLPGSGSLDEAAALVTEVRRRLAELSGLVEVLEEQAAEHASRGPIADVSPLRVLAMMDDLGALEAAEHALRRRR